MSLTLNQESARLTPIEAIDRDLLEILATTHNLTPEQMRDFSRAWGIAESDVRAVEKKLNSSKQADKMAAASAISRVAYGVAHALRLTAGVVERQPGIQDATPERLLEFLDFYEQQTDDLFQQADGMPDSVERLAVLQKLERLSGFWWECRERTGVHDLLEAVDREEAS